MALYEWEARVFVGIAGLPYDEPNATVKIAVTSSAGWTGTMELDEPTHIPDLAIFYVSADEGYAFKVTGRDGLSLQIEKGVAGQASPGRQVLRTEIRSVQLIAHGKPVDRGLAEIEVFNDDSWSASIRLEGSSNPFGQGDIFNLQADGSGIVTVGRVVGHGYVDGSGEEPSISLSVVSWEDSPPPL